MTIDIPEELAKQLEPEHEHLPEIIRRGLAKPIATESALAQEVIRFLANGPEAHEIIAFRPSQESIQRASDLLEKNRESTLTAEERTELDEIAAWNRVFALIKVQARLNLQAAS